MEKVNYLINLTSEETIMCQKLLELPPSRTYILRQLTPGQLLIITKIKDFWHHSALKIAYLLAKRIGKYVPDPVENSNLDEVYKKIVNTYSDLFLAEFDLIIESWEILLKAASEINRPFPFGHPYQLFAEICGQRSSGEVLELFTEEITQETNLTNVQKELRDESNFFRDRYVDNKNQERLEFYKNSTDWFDFVLFVFWNNKNSDENSKKTWKNFLDCHKRYVAIFCNKKFFEEDNFNLYLFIYSREGRLFKRENRKLKEIKPIIISSNFTF
jgi:hypothetical protein